LDRKTIIAVVLCVVLLIFWGKVTEYLGLVKPPPPQDTTQAEQPTADTMTMTPPVQSPTTDQRDSVVQPAIAQPSIDTLIEEKTFAVSTARYDLVFSNYGGGLKKIALKDYSYRNNGNVILADDPSKVVPDFETAGGAYKGRGLITVATAESSRATRLTPTVMTLALIFPLRELRISDSSVHMIWSGGSPRHRPSRMLRMTMAISSQLS
jgi:YidC/Oxa1 family membrane protein insertase